jgi:hypothetical protein
LEPRVTELEAAVEFYRNKAERAEEWLGKISTEIQERVIEKKPLNTDGLPADTRLPGASAYLIGKPFRTV